jgi:hypothetical protein
MPSGCQENEIAQNITKQAVIQDAKEFTLSSRPYSTVNLQASAGLIVIIPQLGVHFMDIQAITHLFKGSRY